MPKICELWPPDKCLAVPPGLAHVSVGTADVTRRNLGSYAGKGLFLSGLYDWAIVTDNQGVQVLVARPKGGG